VRERALSKFSLILDLLDIIINYYKIISTTCFPTSEMIDGIYEAIISYNIALEVISYIV
jgi:hypothetical protein